jgi:integrase
MLLIDAIRDIYAPLQGVSERTERLYGLTVKQFSDFLQHPAGVADLEETQVAKFLAHRLRTRSVATVAKDRAQIRALWEFLARRGVASTWPSVRPIRVPERVPRAWLIDEMRRLIVAAGETDGEVGGVPARLWWRALLLVCFEAGERIGGVLSLEWRDVHEDGIVIRAEGRKGGRRDIWRGISRECYCAIMAIRTDRRLVFDWDRAPTALWTHYTKILRRAGLPTDRGSKFHRVRKTTASFAALGGLDPQAVMDHASAATTRKYLDPRIVRQRQAVDVLPSVFSCGQIPEPGDNCGGS